MNAGKKSKTKVIAPRHSTEEWQESLLIELQFLTDEKAVLEQSGFLLLEEIERLKTKIKTLDDDLGQITSEIEAYTTRRNAIVTVLTAYGVEILPAGDIIVVLEPVRFPSFPAPPQLAPPEPSNAPPQRLVGLTGFAIKLMQDNPNKWFTFKQMIEFARQENPSLVKKDPLGTLYKSLTRRSSCTLTEGCTPPLLQEPGLIMLRSPCRGPNFPRTLFMFRTTNEIPLLPSVEPRIRHPLKDDK